jgi:hypothetical protein
MTKTSLFMEGPPPKSDSPRLRVQVLGVGRWVCAAKATGVSVDARRTADTRRVDLSMSSPVKAMESWGWAEGRPTIWLAMGRGKAIESLRPSHYLEILSMTNAWEALRTYSLPVTVTCSPANGINLGFCEEEGVLLSMGRKMVPSSRRMTSVEPFLRMLWHMLRRWVCRDPWCMRMPSQLPNRRP